MTPSPTPDWNTYAAQLPSDLPDDAYNGAREGFFNQYVMPQALAQGYDTEQTRQQFMNATERPKSAFPRASVAAHQAVESLLSPFAGESGNAQLHRETERAVTEANRQGVNQPLPIIGRPANFAGSLLGMAPYFAVGEGLAAPILEAAGASETFAGLGPIKEALHASTIGTIQGAYDAGSAAEGQKLSAFGKGFASGAALGGGFELLGGLSGILRKAHGLTQEQAGGVEAVVRGNPTDEEVAHATSANLQTPEVPSTIAEATAKSAQEAAKLGIPKDVAVDSPVVGQPEAPSNRRVKINMIGADGKPYMLGGAKGMDTGQVTQALALISNHLDNGGQVVSLGGARTSIQDFLRQVEKANVPDEYKLPIRALTNSKPAVPETVPIQTDLPRAAKKIIKPIDKPLSQEDLDAFGTGSWVSPEGDVYNLHDYNAIEHDALAPHLDQSVGTKASMTGENLDSPGIRLVNKGWAQVRGNGVSFTSFDQPNFIHGVMEAVRVARDFGNDSIYTGDSTYQGLEVPLEDIGEFLANPQKYARMNKPRASFSFDSNAHDMKLLTDEEQQELENETTSFMKDFDSKTVADYDALEEKLNAKFGKNNVDAAWNKYWRSLNQEDWPVPKPEQQKYRFAVNLSSIPHYDNFLQLPNGEVLNKATGEVHPDFDQAESSGNYVTKQTPIGTRIVGDHPMMEDMGDEPAGLSVGTTRYYNEAGAKDRATVVHEKYHGLNSGLDMHEDVMSHLDDPITEQIYRQGFDLEAQKFYGNDPFIYREEVYAHSLDAIRTNDQSKIQALIDADTDEPSFFQWFRDKTSAQLDSAATRPDSIYKRQYERLLNDVQNRATRYLDDINTSYSQSTTQADLVRGDWVTRDESGVTFHDSRETVLQALDEGRPALNVPELVDGTRLMDNAPRFGRGLRPPDGKPPETNSPLPKDLGPEQARGGLQLLSHYIRPFYAWLDTVAARNNWPQLYSAFNQYDRAQIELNNFQKPYIQLLKDGIGKSAPERQKDFFKWFQTEDEFKPKVEQALKFSPKEIATLYDMKARVLDPLENEFGVSLQDYVQKVLPKVDAAGGVTKAYPNVNAKDMNFMVRRLKSGALDAKNENLLWTTGKYLEYGARDKFVDPVLDAIDKVVNEELPDGGYRAGNLKPILDRKLDYLRGVPDYSNQIIKGALEGAVELINRGFDRVNQKLPESMQLKHLDPVSKDPLGKFTLFQYAGVLGLKPATVIRDGLQYFITTLPIAGKYAFTGLQKTFPALRMGADEAKNLWDTASRYGALIERNDLTALYAAEEDAGTQVGQASGLNQKATNFAKWSLGAIQFSHNANRLAAFWGHTEQVLDAMNEFEATKDLNKFNHDSGLWFLDKNVRQDINDELLSGPVNRQDFAHRAAAKLVEASQWNMRRGANPGLYNYSLGRLFGQFGTWPLNYIEYARRFAAAEDKRASAKALTTLAIAHGAILAAGQSVGIDSGRWVFTAPGSDWQGGPLFQAALDLPRIADIETPEGAQARADLRRQIFPGLLPGGSQAERIYQALVTDDPDTWVKVLGFHALNNGDYNRGLHQLLPREDE